MPRDADSARIELPRHVDVGDSPYRTIGLLARGGMGEIELAVHRDQPRDWVYAIKRLRPEHREDRNFHEMFLDEARVAALVQHPNVVRVVGVGSDDRGPYLVMNFVHSINVATLLRWAAKQKVLLPVELVVRIMRQVSAGLQAAHELTASDGRPLNLIHRDISPQNLLVGYDGVVCLTDFGIALSRDRAAKTTTGLLKGKSGYMSPERLRFQRPTQQSDLFSLGVVFYELLSGTRLYSGFDAVDVAQKILEGPTPDIFAVREDVHPAVVELLFELLAKEPSERPPSARILQERLESIQNDITDPAAPLTIESFLSEHFADRRQQDRSQLAQLVQAAPGDPAELPRPVRVTSFSVVTAVTTFWNSHPPVWKMPKLTGRWLWVPAAGLAAGVLLALVVPQEPASVPIPDYVASAQAEVEPIPAASPALDPVAALPAPADDPDPLSESPAAPLPPSDMPLESEVLPPPSEAEAPSEPPPRRVIRRDLRRRATARRRARRRQRRVAPPRPPPSGPLRAVDHAVAF